MFRLKLHAVDHEIYSLEPSQYINTTHKVNVPRIVMFGLIRE